MTMLDRALVTLEGRRGLVTGIANDQSIAWGCAKAFRGLGAELAVTYLNEKAKPHIEPLARQLEAELVAPLDLRREGELEALFAQITERWGRLDFLLHSIAFAPMADLQGRVVDCSKAGFLQAMEISCWSFIRMAKLAEPLMDRGGTLFCMTYYGSQMVVEHYNLMGPVKAALESTTRYLAAELGPKGIRVHAISPGPLKTRAASGIGHFDELLSKAQAKAPMQSLVSIDDVGMATAYLATDGRPPCSFGARATSSSPWPRSSFRRKVTGNAAAAASAPRCRRIGGAGTCLAGPPGRQAIDLVALGAAIMRSILSLALLVTACASMTDPSMGTPVSGPQFKDEIAGQVLSFRLPHGGQAEAQFQPDGTAVYSGPRSMASAAGGLGRTAIVPTIPGWATAQASARRSAARSRMTATAATRSGPRAVTSCCSNPTASLPAHWCRCRDDGQSRPASAP